MTFKPSIYNIIQGMGQPLHFLVSAIWLFLLLLLLITFSNNTYAINTDNKILIVYQKSHGFSQQLITQLEQSINDSGYQTSKILLKSEPLDLTKSINQQLIIAIGSQATRLLLEKNIKTPILSALIPRHISKQLLIEFPNKKNWSSLLIDQPIERQFHLISAILGPRKKAGILLGPYTSDLRGSILKASKTSKHKTHIEEINNSDQISTSLKALSNSSDVLLTLPDPITYNKSTIRGILLLAYRKKLPIIGFSQAYVKAGAVAAVYSKPEQISKQITHIVSEFVSSNNFAQKTYHPIEFSIALNKKIARSLGIKIISNLVIVKQIKQAEAN